MKLPSGYTIRYVHETCYDSVFGFGSDFLSLPFGCWDKTPKEIKEGSSRVMISEISILDQLDPLIVTCSATKHLASWQPGSRRTQSEPELMGFLHWFPPDFRCCCLHQALCFSCCPMCWPSQRVFWQTHQEVCLTNLSDSVQSH